VQSTTTPQPGAGANQQIKRIEAKGNVIVTQKDQTATGENGVFDMASNTVTMTGNVVMTQGVNVVKGDRLWVDMNTGLSRVECKSSECKVQALFQPNAVRDPKADSGSGRDAAKPGGKPAPTASPLHPSKLY